MKKRVLFIVVLALLLLGINATPTQAAAGTTLTVSWTILDEEGNLLDSSDFPQIYAVNTYDSDSVVSNGQVFSAAGSSSGRSRFVMIAPEGFVFKGWVFSNGTVSHFNTSNAGRYRTASVTFPSSGDHSLVGELQKLPAVDVTFAFNSSAIAGVTYGATSHCYGTDDSYDGDFINKEVANGETLHLYAGDQIVINSKLVTGDDIAFSGYYLNGDPNPKQTTIYNYYVVAGTDILDGQTIEVRGVNSGFVPVEGYNDAGFSFETRGNLPWTVQEDGSLASGNKGISNSYSVLKVTCENAGVMLFDYKASALPGSGWLVYKNGTEITTENTTSADNNDKKNADYTGETDWITDHITVAAGDVIYFSYVKSGSNSAYEDTIWMQNFRMASGENASVTVNKTLDAGGTATVSKDTPFIGESISFEATPNTGYQFYGWVKDGVFVSGDDKYTTKITDDYEITAVFGTTGQYEARIGANFYGSIAEAVAASTSGDYVVVTSNATITENITLKSGTYFVIPYNKGDAKADLGTGSDPLKIRIYSNGAEYKPLTNKITAQGTNVTYTLTIASGASLTVGSDTVLSVGGRHSGTADRVSGQTAGEHSEIKIESGGALNVKDGGIVSCCGYIYGDGEVNATNGSKLYENFVVTDFHGGSNFLGDYQNGIFPFNSYIVMNVMAAINCDSTISLFGYCTLPVGGSLYNIGAEVLGSSSALIQMTSGSLSVNYRPTPTLGGVGATIIKIDGDATVGSLKMNLAGMLDVDTATLECPLPYSIIIEQASGELSIESQIKLLPGAEIVVDEGATVSVKNGGNLNVLADDSSLTDHSTYPSQSALSGSDYFPIGALAVAGTLNVEDGAKFSGMAIAVGDGTINVSSGAKADGASVVYVSEDQYAGSHASIMDEINSQKESDGETAIEAGNSYSYDEEGKLLTEELAPTEYTITWVVGDEETQETYHYGDTPAHDIPEKEPDAANVYHGVWSPEIVAVTGDATYTAAYTAAPRYYTVRFLAEDGETVIDEALNQRFTYQAAVSSPAAPDKAETTGYTYEFEGWSDGENVYAADEIPAVAADTDYVASYKATAKKFTITWVNEDGSELKKDSVEYDTMPAYTGDDPSKEGNAQYSYTFAGWTPEIAKVTGDATYKATFTETVNTYTVLWLNEDGTELEKDENVPYGTVPSYDGETPEKSADAQYSYIFADWTEDHTAPITGDTTFTARYNSTVNQYRVTFVNEDGTELQSKSYNYGSVPAYIGSTPTKAATAQYTYTFKGWDKEIVAVTGEATYTAQFDAAVNKYTITWDIEGVKTEEVYEYGKTPEYAGATPTKAADETGYYTFSGWSPEIVAVAADATYTATFTSSQHAYGDPVWAWAEDYSGAEATFPCTTGGEDFVATATISSNTTDATCKAEGETVYTATAVGPGGAEFKDTKTKTIPALGHAYVLKGWTWAEDFSAATANFVCSHDAAHTEAVTAAVSKSEAEDKITYTATATGPDEEVYTDVQSVEIPLYTVTWKDAAGEIILTTQVREGKTPSYVGSTPTKEADAQYSYEFSGWTPAIAAVAGDVTYTAAFTPVLRSYTITFEDYDGKVLDTQTVAYGETPVAPADPSKAATAEKTYTFMAWSPAVTQVTGDATYTATYNEAARTYTITWLMDDDSLIDTTEVAYGEMPAHDAPSKAATAEKTYAFAGWTPALEKVTGDATYKAAFSDTTNTYTVTWKDYDGVVLGEDKLAYGATPSHSNPTRESTVEFDYAFAGWTPEVATVTGNATYTATYTEIKRSYTITWLNEDGSELKVQTLEYGAMPTHADLTKPMTDEYIYTFSGWTPEIATVTGDASYKANFAAEKRTYTITWLNEDGATLEKDSWEYGAMPEYSGEEPTKEEDDMYSYSFSGWTPEVALVTGDTYYTATYEQVAKGAAPAGTFTVDSMGDARKGRDYEAVLRISGTDVAVEVSEGALPEGLALNTSVNEAGETVVTISGKPEAKGSYSFTLAASNLWGYTEQTFAIEVKNKNKVTVENASYEGGAIKTTVSSEDQTVTAIVAIYDENGRFLGFEARTIEAGATEEISSQVDPSSGAASADIFVVTPDIKPAAEDEKLQLQ